MSLLKPRQTPERQSQPFDHDELSSPNSNRTVAVRPSPIKPLKSLGRILFGPFLVSPSPSDTTKSDKEEEDETQSISSSISGPMNHTKQSRRKTILASFKNSRERQSARVNRVDRLIRFIEEIQNEAYVGEKEVIPRQLFPKDYIELLIEVDERDQEFQHYFHHGLRYEYRESIHGKEQFTILMPSAFHISMQTDIDGRLLLWKNDIIGNKNYGIKSKTAAGKIRSKRDQKMEFESKKTLRGDCSFSYREDHYTYPPLIFEVAWSQTTDKLEKKAMELIEEGAGQIRTIVGLDFSKTYSIWDTIRDQIQNPLEPKRGPFTAFVWRVVFDKDGKQVTNASGEPRVRKNNHIFCDDNGTAHLAEKLQLSLRDFVPPRVIKAERWDEVKDLHDVKLELDASTLLGYFDDALIDQKHEDENSESKKERNRQEMTKRTRDRAARRKADAEKEEKRWTITSMIEVGGHRLRKLQGRT